MKSQTERMRGNEVRMPSFFHSSPTWPCSISLSAPWSISPWLAGLGTGQGEAKPGQALQPKAWRGITNHFLILVLRAAGRASGDAKKMVRKNSHHWNEVIGNDEGNGGSLQQMLASLQILLVNDIMWVLQLSFFWFTKWLTPTPHFPSCPYFSIETIMAAKLWHRIKEFQTDCLCLCTQLQTKLISFPHLNCAADIFWVHKAGFLMRLQDTLNNHLYRYWSTCAGGSSGTS